MDIVEGTTGSEPCHTASRRGLQTTHSAILYVVAFSSPALRSAKINFLQAFGHPGCFLGRRYERAASIGSMPQLAASATNPSMSRVSFPGRMLDKKSRPRDFSSRNPEVIKLSRIKQCLARECNRRKTKPVAGMLLSLAPDRHR
jgi:hypothetical protein